MARRYLQQTGFFQNFPLLVNDKQYFYDRYALPGDRRAWERDDAHVQRESSPANTVPILLRTDRHRPSELRRLPGQDQYRDVRHLQIRSWLSGRAVIYRIDTHSLSLFYCA